MPRHIPDHINVPWKIKDALWVFVASWIVLPIMLVIALRIVGPVFPAANHLLTSLINGSLYASFGLVLLDALAAVFLVRYYLKKYRATWEQVGWRELNVWKAMGVLILVFGVFIIAVAVVFAIVTYLIPGFNANQTQNNDFTGAAATAHPSLSLLALVIIPPIIEETVFRGFIFPAIAKRWGLIVGMLLTSALFGLAHLQANVSVYTFVLSMILCYMYWRLKSIIPGIALHMLNNLLAYIALTSGR